MSRKWMLIISMVIVGAFFAFSTYLRYIQSISVDTYMQYFWAIPLVFVALYQEQIKRWLLSPIIKIEFQLQEPFCLKSPTTSPSNPSYRGEAYYFRLRVKNVGRTQAKLCECAIEELSVFKDGGWIPNRTFQPLNLNWSNMKSTDEFLNINPKSPGWFCDLLHVGSGDKKSLFIEYKQPYPHSQVQTIIVNEKQRLKVSIYSENAAPISKHFEVTWSGNWKDASEDMFKEVVIKMC